MLGNETDGIDLDNDDTTLVVTDPATEETVLDVTIPAGSWTCKLKKNGSLKECKAIIEEGGTKMEVKLKPDKKNPEKWKFSFKGKPMTVDLLKGDTVDATLIIGDDIGNDPVVFFKVRRQLFSFI